MHLGRYYQPHKHYTPYNAEVAPMHDYEAEEIPRARYENPYRKREELYKPHQ